MNSETLKALKGSIRKWEKIVNGKGVDLGGENCPLCKLFYRGIFATCYGCPVQEKTGAWGCERTPYPAWWRTFMVTEHPRRANTAKRVKLAKRELEFLKSLLPHTKRNK